MRHLVYLGNANCQPCRDYKERVIDPLIESYPDAIEVHARYDARFAQANALIPVTKVPTIIVEHNGREEFRFSAMIDEEQLEAIITHEGDVLTFEDVMA